jgi:hypothetical protein
MSPGFRPSRIPGEAGDDRKRPAQPPDNNKQEMAIIDIRISNAI